MILGYLAAIVMGFTLGVFGGGGSILTVPILVYLLSIPPVLATTYSLFVVGLVSLMGSSVYVRKGWVHWKMAGVFGGPALIGVLTVRRWLMPNLPDVIWTHPFLLTKDVLVMVVFAMIMLLAATSMLRSPLSTQNSEHDHFPLVLLLTQGFVVGCIAGFVGAGGGFLIVPALVLLAKLPIKTAIGTSLFIIATNSLLGFMGSLGAEQKIDWPLLGSFSSIAIIGIFLGGHFQSKLPSQKLKPAFAVFIIIMGTLILGRELWSMIMATA